jgi:hypothetical protein
MRAVLSILVTLGTLSLHCARADVLEDARGLLAAGDARTAYDLLAPVELDWAGDPAYDYLLGMAALDSGRAGEAVFSLERTVAAEPDFPGARMELARAQFESGDLPAARRQFRYLLGQSPPPVTRAVIERYLAAIDRPGRRPGFGSRPFVEVGAGYDSNANGSTAEQNFLGFTLDPRNVETASGFLELAAGLNHAAAVGGREDTAWVTGLRLGHRFNPQADFIDQSIGSLASGLNWARQRWRGNFGASGYFGVLDGESHEWGAGIDAGVNRRLAQSWELGLTLRAGALRYRDPAMELLDVDRYLGALSLTRMNIGSRAGRFGMMVLGGVDAERLAASAYGNERAGGRLFAGWALAPQSGIYLEAGYLRTDFDATPGFFGVMREDEEFSALVATEYQNWPGRGWVVNPRIRYVRHDSNVALYEHERWEIGLFVRRGFQ